MPNAVGVGPERLAAVLNLPGANRIDLPDVSHRDPRNILPAAATAIRRREFDHDAVTAALDSGRLTIRADLPIGQEADIVVTTVRQLQAEGQTVGVFSHHVDATTALSDQLATFEIAHEGIGLSSGMPLRSPRRPDHPGAGAPSRHPAGHTDRRRPAQRRAAAARAVPHGGGRHADAVPGGDGAAGGEATTREVLWELAGSSWAHLSCHGEADLLNPRESALYLPGFQRLRVPDLATQAAGPEVIVLSSCESARLGSELPDEAVGLPGALVAVGTVRVVGSAWRVPQAATAEITIRLYRHLADGDDVATALRRAQIATRDSTTEEKHELFASAGATYPALSGPGERPSAGIYEWAGFAVYGPCVPANRTLDADVGEGGPVAGVGLRR